MPEIHPMLQKGYVLTYEALTRELVAYYLGTHFKIDNDPDICLPAGQVFRSIGILCMGDCERRLTRGDYVYVLRDATSARHGIFCSILCQRKRSLETLGKKMTEVIEKRKPNRILRS